MPNTTAGAPKPEAEKSSQNKSLDAYIRGPVVTIHVGSGDARESYTIHKALLEEKSQYFRTAFNGSFAESASNEFDLHDDNPIAFHIFVAWLYTSCVREGQKLRPLIHAWILANKLMCRTLQNKIIDSLASIPFNSWVTTVADFFLVLESDFGDSKLMSFMLARAGYLCALRWSQNRKLVKALVKRLNSDHTFRLMESIHHYDANSGIHYATNPGKGDPCKWHEHEPGFKGTCNPDWNKQR